MRDNKITSDPLLAAKLETVDMIAQLGSSAYLIGEAMSDFKNGANPFAGEHCELAETALGELAKQAQATREKIAKWRASLMEGGAE